MLERDAAFSLGPLAKVCDPRLDRFLDAAALRLGRMCGRLLLAKRLALGSFYHFDVHYFPPYCAGRSVTVGFDGPGLTAVVNTPARNRIATIAAKAIIDMMAQRIPRYAFAVSSLTSTSWPRTSTTPFAICHLVC